MKKQTYLKAEFPHLWTHIEKFMGGKTEYDEKSIQKTDGVFIIKRSIGEEKIPESEKDSFTGLNMMLSEINCDTIITASYKTTEHS